VSDIECVCGEINSRNCPVHQGEDDLSHKARKLIEARDNAVPGEIETRCREFSNHSPLMLWNNLGWVDQLPLMYREPTYEFFAYASNHAADIAKRMLELEAENTEITSAAQKWMEKCLAARATNDELIKQNERLKETISYLPKVPTKPYERELAEKNEKLRTAMIQIEKGTGQTSWTDQCIAKQALAETEGRGVAQDIHHCGPAYRQYILRPIGKNEEEWNKILGNMLEAVK